MFLVNEPQPQPQTQETSIEWLITARQAAEVLTCLTFQKVPESVISDMADAGCFQRFNSTRYWFSDVFAYGERIHRAQRILTQSVQ